MINVMKCLFKSALIPTTIFTSFLFFGGCALSSTISKNPIKDAHEMTFDYLRNINVQQPVLVILKNGDSLFGIYSDYELMNTEEYGIRYDVFRNSEKYHMKLPLRYDTLIVFMLSTEYRCQMIGFDDQAIVIQPKDFNNISRFKIAHIDRIFWVRENRDISLDTLALLIEEQNCPKMTVIHVFDGNATNMIPIHDIKGVYKLNVGNATMDYILNEQGYRRKLHSVTYQKGNKNVPIKTESLTGYKKGFFYGKISGSKKNQINWLFIGGAGGSLFFCLGPLWVGLFANQGEFPASVPECDRDFYKGYTDGYRQATKSKKIQTSCLGGILGGSLMLAFILVGFANMTIPINY